MSHSDSPPARRVIALGFFDGVHAGHGALLRRVRAAAERTGAAPCAFTFDTHPEGLIFKSPMPLLSTPADRAWLMRRYYGIEEVIVAPFDDHMMRMPWRDFVTDFLVGAHGAVHLVAGHDFHFGYKGEGNPERLRALCRTLGLGCDIVPKVEQDHITVSSTYIRTLVAQGELERAGRFLGHPHTVRGTLRPAAADGARPLALEPGVLRPAPGLYACRLRGEDGSARAAAVLVGEAQAACLVRAADAAAGPVRLEFYARLEEDGPGGELPAPLERAERYFSPEGVS